MVLDRGIVFKIEYIVMISDLKVTSLAIKVFPMAPFKIICENIYLPTMWDVTQSMFTNI